MSTLEDNGEGIIGQSVFIGGKPHAVLETDHSLSVFPQVDVTTCVLPLSEHKRGRRPPPTPPTPLSPLQIRTTCPPSSEKRAGPHWTSSEGKSASCLDKRRGSCMKRGKGVGNLSLSWALIFLIMHRKLLLQRTLSQSICREDWGSYGVSPLCPLLPGVWAGGVSTNKLEGMPPKDSLHCLYIPRWHLICNGDAVLMCTSTS